MDYAARSIQEVLEEFNTGGEGLSSSEIHTRKKKYGTNEIKKVKHLQSLKLFLRQFNSLLIYVLITAAVISGVIGHVVDAAVIAGIVLLNIIIGYVQEKKAGEIIEKLKRSLRYKVLVIRDGAQQEIDSKELVPGDVILIDAGDKILADCRILESHNLQINEAVLTGESFPVDKNSRKVSANTALAEQTNMLFAGTVATKGKGKALVVKIGEHSTFGKLAKLVQTTQDEKMPLEKKIDSFSQNISIAILIVVALTFALGVYVGIDKLDMFLVSVSLAVGAIPEGLPAVIAITLALAIKQMYKVNTLIRRLPAAETLGRATVICTDKTGTLTEERLTVEEIYAGTKVKLGSIKKLSHNIRQVFEISVLCNNAVKENKTYLGDPTEIALLQAAERFKIDKEKLSKKYQFIEEYEFTSERKMMSVIRRSGKNRVSYVKGAPQFVLEKATCESVQGRTVLLTMKRRRQLQQEIREMENAGLRVLGCAYKKVHGKGQRAAESNLIFAGLIGMIDPPRAEVKAAIKQAVDAGIKIKVITGDSAFTTLAIAKKLGLSGEIIEGKDLEKLSIDRWTEVVKQKTIFARVTPEQKLRVVEVLKKQNETVAVTGDGVNDILALKRADIGIAMGRRGSDIARDSSDMILLDDNFASIIKAVREGRRVYDNIKKSIKLLLAANVGTVLIMIVGLMMGAPLIYLPLSLLWLNLITDSFPALAMATEPPEKNIMKRGVRKDSLLTGIWNWIILAGLIQLVVMLALFYWAQALFTLEVTRTIVMTATVFFQLFFAFSCKSEESLFKTGIINNKYLIYAVFVSALIHILAVYTAVGFLFEFVPLNSLQLALSIFAGTSGLIFFEGYKMIKHHARE